MIVEFQGWLIFMFQELSRFFDLKKQFESCQKLGTLCLNKLLYKEIELEHILTNVFLLIWNSDEKNISERKLHWLGDLFQNWKNYQYFITLLQNLLRMYWITLESQHEIPQPSSQKWYKSEVKYTHTKFTNRKTSNKDRPLIGSKFY